MKPRIWLENERWFVQCDNWPIFGFCLRASAYTYAQSIWNRRKP